MELSKIAKNVGSRVKFDKSKPHSKLTAIEYLLKEEIESNIGQSLDKNNDLTVLEFNESVASKPKPNSYSEREDEEYWSDFSDDDYSAEMTEESKAKEVLSSLQRWVYNSNIESDLNSKYSHRNIISLEEFKNAIVDAGYPCEYIELQGLLKRLDIFEDTGIDYKQFFENLSDKNAAWWNTKLKSNGLEVSAQGRRNGNYRPLCNKVVYEFINSNIGFQAKQAINRAGFLSINEFIDEIFFDYPRGISKKQLRKEFLQKDIPLTRLDTHILYKNLENPQENVIKISDMKNFIDDPQEFIVAKGIDNLGGAQNIWIDEEIVDDNDGLMIKGHSQYDEPLLKLRQHIKTNNVDLEKVLNSVDTSRKGEISRGEFLKFNKAIKSPITVLEQKGLFGSITKEKANKITLSDLGISKI